MSIAAGWNLTSYLIKYKYMSQSERELAFLRDLYINSEWTKRFTDLVDKGFDLKHIENLAYLNAGTGDHCIELHEKIDESTTMFAVCENPELLKIARDKALAVKADISFSDNRPEDNAFDGVIADASFSSPEELTTLLSESIRIAKAGGSVAMMITSAGSFGEVFSLLWEVMFNEGIGDQGATTEEMIAALPSTDHIKELGEDYGLTKIKTETANEVFEFENAEAFKHSPLVAHFLMPQWLKNISESEQELVIDKLTQLIDAEYGEIPFRFTVKATLLTGEKAFEH